MTAVLVVMFALNGDLYGLNILLTVPPGSVGSSLVFAAQCPRSLMQLSTQV